MLDLRACWKTVCYREQGAGRWTLLSLAHFGCTRWRGGWRDEEVFLSFMGAILQTHMNDWKCLLCSSSAKHYYYDSKEAYYIIKCSLCVEYHIVDGYFYNLDRHYENPHNYNNEYTRQFNETRHKLAGFFFELNTYRKEPELDQYRLNPEGVNKISNLPSVPRDTDYKAKIIKLLEYYKYNSKYVGAIVKPENTKIFRSVLYARNGEETLYLLELCKEYGYIEGISISQDMRHDSGTISYSAPKLTPEGWDYLESRQPDSKQIFVAMEFTDEMFSLFSAIKKPIESKTKYVLYDVGRDEFNASIIDRIFAAIQRSQAIIADFTHGNSGAYFEAGYAKGLGLAVIYTCRKDVFEGEKIPHFDIRQEKFILWENEKDLEEKLIDRIKATLPILI